MGFMKEQDRIRPQNSGHFLVVLSYFSLMLSLVALPGCFWTLSCSVCGIIWTTLDVTCHGVCFQGDTTQTAPSCLLVPILISNRKMS